jgi:hypothetical protein
MKQKRHNNISESQVEEAIIRNLHYLNKILCLDKEIRLISKQLWIKDRKERIDLLVSHGKSIVLIELKVVKFSNDYLDQIISYRDEILLLQKNGEIMDGDLSCYLLVTHATDKQIDSCLLQNIFLVIYEPLDVLEYYFNELTENIPFLSIRPKDFGVYNIGLINRALFEIFNGESLISKISERVHLSNNSIKNHLIFAKEFGLIRERNRRFYLTDIGDKFISGIEYNAFKDNLEEYQKELLKQFISNDPFYSSTVFGIYSIVESAFILSRNEYPIQLDELRKEFIILSGKKTEWKSQRSINTSTYTFLNYAIDLDLLGKIGKQVVITPSGFNLT